MEHDPDNWRVSTTPGGCKAEVSPAQGMGVHIAEPSPMERLRIQRDEALLKWHRLHTAVREYFEAADLFDSAVSSRAPEDANRWCDIQHEREAALRRLVGMEADDAD